MNSKFGNLAKPALQLWDNEMVLKAVAAKNQILSSFVYKEGGAIAGDARRALEKKSGHKVVSKSNFLDVNAEEMELIPEK